jgi:gliding motility-associated-like protein
LKYTIKYLLLLTLFAPFLVSAQQVRFIENKGQWKSSVLYKADIPGGDLYITNQGLVYNLVDEHALHEQQHNKVESPIHAHAVFIDFAGANTSFTHHPFNPFVTQYNYYIGNDETKWGVGVKAYQKVLLRNVYPQIDFEIVGENGGVKTAFIVRQGAQSANIKLAYRGANQLRLVNNELIVQHNLGQIKELKPVSFISNGSKQEPVESSYLLNNDTLSYNINIGKGLSHHDSLIIDPSIVFSTFSGSVADNFGFTATHDHLGNAYGGGTVYNINFPVTSGAYQIIYGGGNGIDGPSRDAGILKFSANGSQLLYATYLGGWGNEQPHSMSCDASGNLYVMGTTQSSNFPFMLGVDSTHNGGYDLFVSCLSANGNILRYSTYLGGTQNDGFNNHITADKANQLTYNFGDEYRGDIRLDALGNVYIATVTSSNQTQNLPLVNASQSVFGGAEQDGWVIKLNTQLNTILLSTYIGGNGVDAAYGLRIDEDVFYVTGGTLSSNLPRSSPSLYKGGVDGFVAKFNQTGGTVLHQKTVYVGTFSYDQSYFVYTDKNKNVYITGQTMGFFPHLGSGYYEAGGKQFITVFDPQLNTVLYQTLFGSGSQFPKLSPSAFMVDECNQIYFSGWGGNTNLGHNPNTSITSGLVTTSDAFQRSSDGSDFYLIVFDKRLSRVAYATYFGGNITQEHVDGGTSHFDEMGIVYQSVCAGCGGLSDFPTTPGAHSRTNNGLRTENPNIGGCNNAVFKFDCTPNPIPPVMKDTVLYVMATDTLNYTFDITDINFDSIAISDIVGEFPNIPPPNNATITILQNKEGLIRVNLKWIAPCNRAKDTLVTKFKLRDFACRTSDTSSGYITIIVKPMPELVVDLICAIRSGDSDMQLRWNNSWTNNPNAKYISHIKLYRNSDGGNFDSIAQFTKADLQDPYLDKNLIDLNAINYCYKVITQNLCGVQSGGVRLSCTQLVDSFDATAYTFGRDTIYYVRANDTLNASLKITDNEFADSLFLSYTGVLMQVPFASVTHKNGVGSAEINLRVIGLCDRIGDTLKLEFIIQDNRCPIPIRDRGRLFVVVLPPLPAVSPELNCIKLTGANQVGISWPIPSDLRVTKSFTLLKQDASGAITQAGKFENTFNEQVLQSIINPTQQNTCFALMAHDYCDNPTDTGDFVCIPWTDEQYPEPIQPHYVTVVNNKQVELSWPATDHVLNEIYRFDLVTQQKQKMLETTATLTDTTWVDEQVDVQKYRYCYVIEPTNACGLKPKQNKPACSILLNGVSKPFEHNLSWTTYDFFVNGTNRHDLFKRDYTEQMFSLRASNENKNANNFDADLNKETGLFYYYVVAPENQPSVYSSQSNTVELVQAPLLHVPNAFTPNNDGVNDLWNVVPVFVKDYHCRVYDRWGRLVFETKDKKKLLSDRDLGDAILAEDAFVYVITYTGFEGSFKQVTGNVTILK